MSWPYTFPIVFGDDEPNDQIKALLPRGAAWRFEQTSLLSGVAEALTDEVIRVKQRGHDLLNESVPTAALETLEDWERVVRLPDDIVTSIPATAPARRIAIIQKLVRQGGQTAAFYVSLAAACGYSATVTDPAGKVLRSGFRSKDRCYGQAWAFTWQLNASPPAGPALTHAQLIGVMNRAKPAHTVVIVNFL